MAGFVPSTHSIRNRVRGGDKNLVMERIVAYLKSYCTQFYLHRCNAFPVSFRVNYSNFQF